jgi:hypothetical protein
MPRPIKQPEQGRAPKLTYQVQYLKWMQKVEHPDLAKSNFNADKFLEERKYRAN